MRWKTRPLICRLGAMPIHFDRFRLLNDRRDLRNESGSPVYLKAREEDEPIVLLPGEEAPLPVSPEGETLIDVPKEG